MTGKLNQLTAISPIDGRYFEQTQKISLHFSEFSLIKHRAEIELKYLVFLSKIGICRKLSPKEKGIISKIYENFSLEDAQKVKRFEKRTKHDVKALEYFLRSVLAKSSLKNTLNWLHFGLTSYDLNDNAYRLMLAEALRNELLPQLDNLVSQLQRLSKESSNLPMLGRTHGQAAVPTTFGKEMAVFHQRIKKELNALRNFTFYGKFGGAVGNWNSLKIAYPKKNWPALSGSFLRSLGLKQNRTTTQVAPPEDIIVVFQNIYRINSILIDFNQDIWRYISDDWVIQKGKEKDVGSSTIPQKINPIEFENSEGNLTLANGIFEIFCRKLPISRLQRDLSDSTVLRNIGVALAYCLMAYLGCQKGVRTIRPNFEKVLSDLNADWSVLTEALQTILRKNYKADAYEKVASKVRGEKLNREDWINLVNSFDFNNKDKDMLLKLTPRTYIGYASKIPA